MVTKELVRKAIADGVIDTDGWVIMASEYYTDAGFDCAHLNEVQSSVTGDVEGIHSLDFYSWLAKQIGLENASGGFRGKGFRAQNYLKAFAKWAGSI